MSFRDILPSMRVHYYEVNGRIVLHALAQVFLMMGKPVFNMINAFSFAALLLLISFYSYGSMKRVQIDGLFLILFMIWYCTPEFGQSFLWLIGASNYLYGILLVLLFFMPYYKTLQIGDGTKHPGNALFAIKQACCCFLMLVFGILAGWTNENTSVACIVMIIGILALYRTFKISWRSWMLFGLFGNIMGCYGMLTAPAQVNRLKDAGGMGSIMSLGVRGIHITMDLFTNLTPIIFFIIVCVPVVFRKKEWRTKENAGILIFLLGAITSVYSMVAAPVFVGRVWSGPIVLWCVVAGMVYAKVSTIETLNQLYAKLGMSVLAVSFLLTYANGLVYIKKTYDANQDRIVRINQQKAEGKTDISLPIIYGYTKYTCYSDRISDGDLSPYPDYWGNVVLAKYYGVERIEMEQ